MGASQSIETPRVFRHASASRGVHAGEGGWVDEARQFPGRRAVTLSVSMSSRWFGHIETAAGHLRPSSPPDEALRLKNLVGQVSVGLVVSVLGAIANAIDRSWLASGFIALFAVLMIAGLAALRVTAVRFSVVAQSERLLLVGFLVLMCLQTETPQPEQLYWFALVPMASALTLGQRGAWEGLLLGVLGAGVAVGSRNVGLHFDAPPHGPLVFALDLVEFLLAFTALAVVFETLRARHAHEAERAAKARGLFLANVSHELRTPMNGVIGLAELLASSPLSPVQREYLALLRRSGESMVALINDLLDLTKLESGQFLLEHAPVSLGALLGDVTALVGPGAGAKGVRVEARLDPTVPAWLEGDALRLKQVLLNLVGNAIKFTDQGGAVTVTGRWGDGWLELVVDDQGIGMSPEVVARLFKPFHQADETTTRRFGGTGLGLAITAELARLMGGEIRVESVPQKGSTFRVRVRAPATHAPASRETPAPELTAGLKQGRVLLVEDNPISQVVGRGLCERLGFEVEVAANGQEALAAVQARDFRLVLMDCQMPLMDGYEATAHIRQLPEPRRHVPIVALTASAYREELDECLAAGMNDTLTKPLTSGALQEVLERVLARRPPVTS